MSIMKSDQPEIMVSVLMITYNHEQFITQAIDSVLMQQTDFEYELIIGEDCSTDSTREIVIEYAGKHPEKIRPLLHDHNLGMMGKYNFVAVYKMCQGKYIALLEGDDYWTDPYKLQKQVEFLENHPECTLCAHNTKIVYENCESPEKAFLPKTLDNFIPAGQEKIFDIEELFKWYFMHTSSIFFRNGVIKIFPEYFYRLPMADWGLFILLALSGRIGYVNEIMSAYRIHSNGIWNGLLWTDKISNIIMEYQIFYENLDPKYHPIIIEALAQHLSQSAENYLDEKYPGGLPISSLERGAREYVNTILNSTTFYKAHITQFRRKFYSCFYSSLGFRLYKDNQVSAARKCLFQAFFYDLSSISNRGYWSIIFESILGKKLMNLIRRII